MKTKREPKIVPTEQDVLAVLEDDGAHRTIGGIDYWIGAAHKLHYAYAPGDTYCNQPQLKALVARLVHEGRLVSCTGAELQGLGVVYDVRDKATYYLTARNLDGLAQAKLDRESAQRRSSAEKRATEILAELHPEDFAYLVARCLEDPEFRPSGREGAR